MQTSHLQTSHLQTSHCNHKSPPSPPSHCNHNHTARHLRLVGVVEHPSFVSHAAAGVAGFPFVHLCGFGGYHCKNPVKTTNRTIMAKRKKRKKKEFLPRNSLPPGGSRRECSRTGGLEEGREGRRRKRSIMVKLRSVTECNNG